MSFSRPYGTGHVGSLAHPAIHRWATFGRPYGTGGVGSLAEPAIGRWASSDRPFGTPVGALGSRPGGRDEGIAWAASGDKTAASPAAGTAAQAGNAYLPTTDELKLGREGAAEAEKQYKIVKDGEQVRRIQRVGDEVVRAASDPDVVRAYLAEYKLPKARANAQRAAFAFSFKLAESKEVNAFSFAGGPVYLTTGLLNYVQSDHELAAVMAHEVAHVMHHHLVQLIQRQSKTESKMLWAMLAAVLTGAYRSPDFGNVMMGAQLYSIAKQFGYGRDAERDADKTGVQYLLHTRYNPMGMLTVMRRFAADEARHGGPELGIFQSHPYSRERVQLLVAALKDAGIKVDLSSERVASNAFRLETRAATADGQPVGEIVLNGDVMFRATAAEGKSPLERAQAIEQRLNELLEQNLTLHNVTLSPDKSQLLARGTPFLTVYPSDAVASGMPGPQTSQRALDVLLKALWREQLDQVY